MLFLYFRTPPLGNYGDADHVNGGILCTLELHPLDSHCDEDHVNGALSVPWDLCLICGTPG